MYLKSKFVYPYIIKAILSNITTIKVDAIVNAAEDTLMTVALGAGTDGVKTDDDAYEVVTRGWSDPYTH